MKYSYLREFDTDLVSKGTDFARHWCSKSEPYADAEALLTLLHKGYRITGHVVSQEVPFSGNRHSEVFYFCLQHRNAHIIYVPVLRNPIVMRLIRRFDLKVRNGKKVPKAENTIDTNRIRKKSLAVQ